MNSVLYQQQYDELTARVAQKLAADQVLSTVPLERLVSCDAFVQVDQLLLGWLRERLLSEDVGAQLGTWTIEDICRERPLTHFGQKYQRQYQLMASALHLVKAAIYQPAEDFPAMVAQYVTEDYQIDRAYRLFYTMYDQLDDHSDYAALRELIENIYTNDYLSKQLPAWNKALSAQEMLTALPLARYFYDNHLRHAKERTVVIISDALRYEVGWSLQAELAKDVKSTTEMTAMLGMLPSYTSLGMAALLPHETLAVAAGGEALLDGRPCGDLASRRAVLARYVPESTCVAFDALKGMKTEALREIFTGKQVVYIYHNQIDARGESLSTEQEVLQACQEAVEEIAAMIRQIASRGNTYHFLVSADHGFLYKRDKLQESDKIGGMKRQDALVSRRFVLASEPVMDDGVGHITLGDLLGSGDARVVSFPVGSSVFKTAGGANYVHGGSSPQELILPLLEVKMERYAVETQYVQVLLVTMVHKITNLVTALDFVQAEPVSEVVKAATLRFYFVDAAGNRISTEQIFRADKQDEEAQKRIFRLRFTFKSMQYDRNKPYYLVALNDEKGEEVLRHEVFMDLVF